MGKSSTSSKRKKSLEISDDYSSPSLSSSSESESSDSRRRRRRRRTIRDEDRSSNNKKKKRHHRHRQGEKSSRKRDKSRRRTRENYSSSTDDEDEPETLVLSVLEKFPRIAHDLEQLLQMIDNGQGVDVTGISDKSLVRHLKKLFFSLKLKQKDDGVFILPPLGHRTLDVIGPILCSHRKSSDNHVPNSGASVREHSLPSNLENMENEADASIMAGSHVDHDSPIPTRRSVIGPEMPSRELLAAAAELAEAETLLREADLEADNDLLIGPPPPAMVAEAESANEAERFEEVARIAGAESEKPYDVLGVNWKMSSDNIKKRYWKLSLMVHPDKCSHPQAHQAFVKLNQAFKDLQDPTKRKAIDEKIKLKEEQEAFKVELKELCEAAKWRQSQGITMEGDEEILAMSKEAEVAKRDEWMTTLPPEKKPGMSMQSRSFSKTTKEGRGDTSAWTDTPLDRAEKAKQNYLEAYNKTRALGESEDRKKSADADLVDKYNSSKRSVSLLQKHQEGSRKNVKRKSKQQQQQSEREKEKEEWVGQHPWKPWDREKDLTAGRQKVDLDSGGMTQALSSRFSSGTMQRNFL